MLFNSIEFLIFLPLVFFGYWFVFKSLRWQNLFVVAVSYLFYGWWDWRFLLLILFTSLCSYLSGVYLEKCAGNRSVQKWISAGNILLNLSILGVFKYFDFFTENLVNVLHLLGWDADYVTLNILLPVGISFYTFQALSYTIDVYQGKIKATHDIVAFFAYISFFPQLVAGPIERATHLLPQFLRPRNFDCDLALDGIRQMLWGFFKKVVVADNCALFVNGVFENYQTLDGSTLFLGAFFFTIQIYGDFSGYSDIAIGCARLFGIDLMQNFKYPYFSRDIAEFWRRWHISLTTWFRDYIYIPLGGSRVGKWKSFRNTLVIFLVSGFWHGANWTFVAWGAYHALLFLPLLLLGQNRRYRDSVAENSFLPSVKELTQMGVTFLLVLLGWILFRMRRFFIAIFRYLGVVGCLGLLSCLLIRSYFHISVPSLKSDPEVEVLILGDSHPLHSISADMLGKSRNDAKSSENYFNTYIDLCLKAPYLPHLKTVILGFGYHTFTVADDSYQDEFPAYMSIYPHLKEREDLRPLVQEAVSPVTRKEVMYSYEFGVPFKNCVAEIKRNVIERIFTGATGGTLDVIIDRHYYDDKGAYLLPSSFQQEMLGRIVEECKKRDLSLILYNAPVSTEYMERVPSSYRELTDSLAREYVDDKTVFYLNYTAVSLPDSCYRDADHLNEIGIHRFTPLLKDTLTCLGVISE